MKTEITQVVAALRELVGNYGSVLTPVEKVQYVSATLGMILGSSLTMPSTPVDIPRNFFLMTHSERVSDILGQVNEIYPINFDLALSLTDNVYLARYRLVFEPTFTFHMLEHLAGCTDDVVPTTIVDVLCKMKEANKDNDYDSMKRVLCTAVCLT